MNFWQLKADEYKLQPQKQNRIIVYKMKGTLYCVLGLLFCMLIGWGLHLFNASNGTKCLVMLITLVFVWIILEILSRMEAKRINHD